jgi:hypothetical protein
VGSLRIWIGRLEVPKKLKPNMTVTARFPEESQPLAVRRLRGKLPDTPPNRRFIGRLSFRGPSPKLDWSAADLAQAIGEHSLQDAVVFLDTNVFTKELDMSVWDAFDKRRIFITPGVWKELLPWLKTPFHNKPIRDRVLAGVRSQVKSAQSSKGFCSPRLSPSGDSPKIDVISADENFMAHGYDYYFKLLGLRKAWGPLAASVLTKKLGRSPTKDEFLAEVQGKLGARGFLLARKGLEEVAKSAYRLADEQLVVLAAMTAIMRGKEVFIVTRDPDVLEQYYKVINLMKEHYRAMLVADRYAANPSSMPFREVPVERDGVRVPEFSSSSILQLETTDAEFNPLPAKFHFVVIYCLLLGGEPAKMKVTYCSFCAETEMAQMLRVKASTGGLSTNKFDGRNCTISTAPLTPENHRVVVSIGKETVVPFGNYGSFGFDDFYNTLFENERTTRIRVESLE